MSELKLTTKQKKFCWYYLKCGNATKSAIKAGYSVHTARETGKENLTKPYVKKYLNGQEKELHQSLILSADQIQQFLSKVIRGNVSEDVILASGDGIEIKDKKRPDISDRVSASKELLKMPLQNAKTKKELAEYRIKKLQAQENNKSANRAVTQTDTLLNKMENFGKKSRK